MSNNPSRNFYCPMLRIRVASRFVCFVVFGLVWFNGQAQNYLNHKIYVYVQNSSIVEILGKIEEEEEVFFSYPSDIIPAEKRITKEFRNQTLRLVLDDILGPGFRYLERGSYIIIQSEKKNKENNKNVLLSGKLIDQRSGNVVSNATVYEVNSLRSTQTDSNGNYTLNVSGRSEYLELAVSKESYMDTVLRIYKNDSFIHDLRLKPYKDFEIHESEADQLKIVRKLAGKEVLINMENVSLKEKRLAQFSVLPFLGTNGRLSGKIANRVSLNLIAGYSYSLSGLEVGGVGNIQRHNVDGIQIAGMFNVAGGHMYGIQFSGLANHVHYTTKGLQLSGLSNAGVRGVDGAQITGLINFGRDVRGLQLSGMINYSEVVTGLQVAGLINLSEVGKGVVQCSGLLNGSEDFSGIQVAGLINIGIEEFKGAQISGLINFAEDLKGVQISSLFNTSRTSLTGVQISGMLNVCGKLNGVQLGVVNLCDTVESGVNIGLLSFVRHGMHTLHFYHSDVMDLNVSFKTGSPKFYNIVSAGTGFDSTYMFGYGIGSLHQYSNGLFTGSDLQFNSVQSVSYKEKSVNLLSQLSPFIGYKLWKHAHLSLGPVLNVYYQRGLNNSSEVDDFGVLSNSFYSSVGPTDRLEMSLGYRVGLFF